MKKQILAVASAALVAMMAVVPAFAQEEPTGSITIEGQDKNVAGANIDFGSVELTGKDLTDQVGTTPTEWTVTDYSGAGVGWEVQIAATQLKTTAEVAGAIREIPMTGFEMTVPDPTLVTTDGATGTPAEDLYNVFSRFDDVALEANPLTVDPQSVIYASPEDGMGQYAFQPTFTLDIPATTYVGTYQSTITLSFVTVPGGAPWERVE